MSLVCSRWPDYGVSNDSSQSRARPSGSVYGPISEGPRRRGDVKV